jgi:hypothetical protein
MQVSHKTHTRREIDIYLRLDIVSDVQYTAKEVSEEDLVQRSAC